MNREPFAPSLLSTKQWDMFSDEHLQIELFKGEPESSPIDRLVTNNHTHQHAKGVTDIQQS